MRRIFLLVVTIIGLSTACSSSSQEGLDATSQTGSSAESYDSGNEDKAATGTNTTNTDVDTDSGQPATKPTLGRAPNDNKVAYSDCTIDQFPRPADYAISGIKDDDPDGGLIMRQEPGDGDRIDVLAEDTVVMPSLEMCVVTEDGGAWWEIFQDGTGQSGWVNSAWLTHQLGPQIPRYYEAETKRDVIVLLDSLASEDWAKALTVLVGEGVASEVEEQVGDLYGADAETNLAAYCETHICDAPYEVVESTGIASSVSLVNPTVKVRFSYPDGEADEVFSGLVFEGMVDAVKPLPGRSVMALTKTPPSIKDLLDESSEEPSDPSLYEAAERIRSSLISESGAQVPADMIPDAGIIMSARTTIVSEPEANAVITADDLADDSKDFVFEYSESGVMIESVAHWMNSYRRNLALLEPDSTGVNVRLGIGNSINNLAATYPDADVVELYRQGRGELSDFNWSSVRLVLQQQQGQWKLLAIMGDGWTI